MRGECGDTTLPGEVVTHEDDRFESFPPWSWVSRAKILCRPTDLGDSVVRASGRFDVDTPVVECR